ncbi:trigger factor [Agromyces marinus]|uniref:Trigger factor n=1 Tax=Agromyces marinus TaxID=1389020 RepID=A0ABM8H610_9MICO|nr:trigger factor [Agromyces marinus]UIP58802.1 Trigger factor [Agromyces marinus]BDZ56258.1 trigger factor [Agromyces marinus]
MPTTSVEKLSPTRAKLTISVTPDELKPSIAHAYEHIAEQINVPGFRKGKVPAPVIDQRVGKAAVLEHAVNEGLDGFYRAAVTEHELRPLGRPAADIVEWPNEKDFSGDLLLSIEVDVRPEIELPEYAGLELTVDAVEVSDDEITEELERLRTRFGTLVTVDRPATSGDFATIDLVATIDGAEVDTASGVSYELGSGELLEGIDDALDSLTAGETTTFASKLLGGEHEGETAEITVTVTAVKERELPEANDDFAQIASEFDTLDELTASLKDQIAKNKSFGQGSQARDLLVDRLLELVEVPVADSVIEDEVHRHLDSEGRLEDDEHRAEVTEASTKAFKTQIVLDAIAEAEKVQVGQEELTQYLVQGAAQYGMDPNEFVQVLSQNGQIPAMVGEVARNKALAIALGKVTVKDAAGGAVDLSEFTAVADESSEADEDPAAEEPAEQKPARKRAAKKAAADAPAEADAEAPVEEKKPARKRAAKKADAE